MRSGFILSCESTIDLPYSYCEQRDIPVLFYSYQVDGVSYEDDMGRDPETLPQFYGFLDAVIPEPNAICSTSPCCKSASKNVSY